MRNLFISLSLTFLLLGCTPEMGRMGSSILSQTGLVSGSQADAIFAVGEKLSKAAETVSDEQEYYLGRSVSATILSRYDLYKNQSPSLYLNKVGAVLAAHSSRPETFGGYHIGILNTDQINAVSAPGGFIFISKGFLKILDSEDELAAVIAHEIGHVALQHGLSAVSESNLTDALQIASKEALSSSSNMAVSELNSLFGDSVNEVAGTLLDKGYSRSQEYNADTYAAKLLKEAGYNPAALKGVFAKLETVSEKSGGWFDTHPSGEKRASEIDEDLVADSGNASGEKTRTARFKKIIKGNV